MPRVSIVVPAYNSATLLGATLESVLQSSYCDYEVIVVNDGSQDQTADVASRFGHHVRVINQANSGVSASRNRGIESGDSEFIALLDSDDLWHPDKLKYQISRLDDHQDYSFCYTNFVFWDGADSSSFMKETRTGKVDENSSGWIYHQLILENWVLNSTLLFRRRAWNEMGHFLCADQQTDDWEYLVRSSQNFKFVRLAEPMVLYRQYAGSLSRKLPSKNTPELMRESLLLRYGMHSVDGTPVNEEELEKQRYIGWSNFADAHCARGTLRIGLATFFRLLLKGPKRTNSLKRIFKSLGRRLFPKRSSAT